MSFRLAVFVTISSLTLAAGLGAASAKPPAQPIDFAQLLDEMRSLDRLARFPDPAYRQLQASSYNRLSVARDQPEQGTDGWFADSDGVTGIREETIDGRTEWVIMEHEGPGCLTKFWTPFFYYDFNNRVGPKVRIYLDGASEPVIDAYFIELLTHNDWPASYGPAPPQQNQQVVPEPFAGFTARAGNLYLPIPFGRSCKVTLSDKPFYNIVNYRAYPAGTPVKTFAWGQVAESAALLKEVGDAIEQPVDAAGDAQAIAGELAPGESAALELPQGAAAVRQLEFRIDPQQIAAHPELLRSTVLKIRFDGEETIWCPLGDFFSSTNALHPLQTWNRSVTADGTFVCRWTMPYRSSATVTVENLGARTLAGELRVVTDGWQWDDRSMHFWCRWRPDEALQGHKFADWNFVDVRGQGVLVGDAWTVVNLTDGWWGEGDEKIYVDDAYDVRKFPDHFGTGTEDYYGWAGGVNPTRDDVFHRPLLANVSVGSTDNNSTRGFNICTRFRSLDAVPFTERLVFDMEASPGVDQRNAWDLLGYSAVTYFYALPGASTNRPADSAAAARPLMSLEKLLERSAALRAAAQ